MGASSRLDAQDKTGFPEGFDAAEAAPQSHKVLFENAFVRVLQVQVAPGTKEPMHHHRRPSMFLVWDTGGRTEHIRISHADGSVHDLPSRETPVSPGSWRVTWLNPEPMHSIENVETPESVATHPNRPPTVRVEFKFAG
jgi:predicted metal-dependent enzyme (double-stranded beta helix superfamily)